MVTCLIVLAAVSLVVVAFQISCFIAYQGRSEREVEAPLNGCTEP